MSSWRLVLLGGRRWLPRVELCASRRRRRMGGGFDLAAADSFLLGSEDDSYSCGPMMIIKPDAN